MKNILNISDLNIHVCVKNKYISMTEETLPYLGQV